MLCFVVFDEGLRHIALQVVMSDILLITYHHLSPVTYHLLLILLITYHINEDVHRAAANHSFFARLLGRQRKVVQCGLARPHGFARLSPNFSFDATTTHRSSHCSILEEQHLRPTLLWGRATCLRNGGHNDALASLVGFTNHAIEITLCNRSHKLVRGR